jgi:hypothetical protein
MIAPDAGMGMISAERALFKLSAMATNAGASPTYR